MIDTSHIDLLALIQNDTALKRVAGTKGGEYHGPCPFCNGKDRFRVQPYRQNGGYWACRQCEAHGDAVAYIMKRDNVEFNTALKTLNMQARSSFTWQNRSPTKQTPDRSYSTTADSIALNDVDWQEHAKRFCSRGFDHLHEKLGKSAKQYLLDRGLSEVVIDAARLGYNPSDYSDQWGTTSVWLPKGIVIPWQLGGVYWRVRVRRLIEIQGYSKYTQAKGSANGLYFASPLPYSPAIPGVTVVLTEGEFDTLAFKSNIRQLENHIPVATGSVSNGRLLQWIVDLSMADRVLLAFDADDAGDNAATWWKAQLQEKAVRLRPTCHDINDMVKAGCNLEEWINNVGHTE